jgi:phosphoribosyl 1,2-cyclic phosphate phosphodiesterase
VLLTHDHADHCHGINDLRHLNRLMGGAGIAIHGWGPHLDSLRAMFPYSFGSGDGVYGSSQPALRTDALDDGRPTRIAGLDVTPFAMEHGAAGRTTGFRCGSMAYCTDLTVLPAIAEPLLRDLDLLAISALREQPHPTHQNVEQALAVVRRLRPRRAVLIHLGPEIRHADWAARLPPGVEMAVDGWSATLAPEQP